VLAVLLLFYPLCVRWVAQRRGARRATPTLAH
jgi:hypothetical protein